VKGLLLPLSLIFALVATGGLAFVALQGGDAEPAEPEPRDRATDAETPEGAPTTRRRLRRYQTTATLVEDLRDALAGSEAVHDECWRVSNALSRKATWSLANLAPAESSPRVRALLVLATGVHNTDTDLLLGYLDDRAAQVRRAAALACGHDPDGKKSAKLLGVTVQLGRSLSERTDRTLRDTWRKESDAAVRSGIEAVLDAAGLTPPQ